MRPDPTARIFAFLTFGLVIAAAAFVLLFDFRGLFERRASTAVGKPVTVGGLHIRIFPLRLTLEDLAVAGADHPLMHAGHVDATLAFWRLVKGELAFPRLAVDDAVVEVERTSSGTNWDSGRKPLAADPKLPEIQDLSLHATQLKYRDPATKTDLTLHLETRERADGGERQLLVKGEGGYAGAPTTLALTGGSILTLREAVPYPVDIKMTSGATQITAKGTVTDPVHIAGLDVALTVKGADAADLYRIAGIALPPTPAYEIVSHVARNGRRWMFQHLTWKMGESDLAGDLTWDLSKGKPRLEGQLRSETLDLDDMAGFIGAAPGKAKTPVEVKQEAAARERAVQATIAPPPETDASGKQSKPPEVARELIIPDATLDVRKINSMNATVSLAAAHIAGAGFPVDNLNVTLTLDDGVLKLKPMNFGVGEGHIVFDIAINTAKPPVHTDAMVDVQNYPLDRLLGAASQKIANTTFGAIGGRIEIHGNGDSMHRILATSDGAVGLVADGGEISDLVVTLMGLNLAKAAGLLVTGDKPVPIRCMAADFGVDKGLMTARALVFDTKPSITTGQGTINLATEVMNLKLYPKQKALTVGTLRVPLHVSGTFAAPSIGPDAKALALRGGAATALGVLLTPLGSLLATIELGRGKNADCAALIAQK